MVISMGRFVTTEKGNLEWASKFVFGQQCSNFGEVLGLLEGEDICVERYKGESGEYVYLHTEKDELVRALENLDLVTCPVCGRKECLEATKEMINDFKEAVKQAEQEIDVTFFVEY
jgi:peptide subunit release factor 1 (eRF1)